MNFLKRACLYLVRKIGKTATLFVFLLVMATLMLTCLSIRSATKTANTNIKKALLGYFTINAKHLDTGITEDVLNQILAIDGLSGNYALRSYSYANYYDTDGNSLEISTEGAAQTPVGYENAGKIVANSNSENDSYFTEGGFELTEGNALTFENRNAVLIHEKFAKRNGLTVGDTMRLSEVTNENCITDVTVAGIFTSTKEQDSIGIAPSYDLYDNIVFTDLSTASYLLYGTTEGESNIQYGDFYVNDPEELDRIMEQVQEINGVDWNNCTLTRYDKDYQNAKKSLEGLQNIVSIAIAVVAVICFLVLDLFLTLWLRGRIHETGIYLAIGISKRAILLQYLFEAVIVATIALLLSYGASSMISDQIGNNLLSQVTAETYETVALTDKGENKKQLAKDLGLSKVVVAVSVKDYVCIWGFGLVLCLASTTLAAYPILKLNPKNILSQMS